MTSTLKLFQCIKTISYVTKRQSYRCKHNLQSLLLGMPKLVTHTAALKKQRQKLKEKSQKYVPGIVSLQVLGSGATGAPRALYMFTDQSRYMFNCGEGTQRLAHEHKMKLAKLEHIFFTYGSWNNIGGLPGVSLTIQDVGVPEITLHGPEGIDDIFKATRRFIVLKDLNIKMADCTKEDFFEDNVMKVEYLPLELSSAHRSRRSKAVSLDRHSAQRRDRSESSDTGCSTTDDETDYYAYERETELPKDENGNKAKKKKKKKKRRSSSVQQDGEVGAKRRCVEQVGTVAIAYICRLHDRPGALSLEACVERGVPPGPLLGRLKSGEDITLPDGALVKSADVTSPDDPGAVFIVVECPDERFLEPLENERRFAEHQTGAANPEDIAYLVVHFSPPHIVNNPRYKRWMDAFPQTTQHLMINEDNVCKGSVAVHRIQHKLHLLDPQVFPLLSEEGVLISSGSETSVASDSTTSLASADPPEGPVIQSRTFTTVQLRPSRTVDSSSKLVVNPSNYIKEAMEEEGVSDALAELKKRLAETTRNSPAEEYPSVVFLGTGSCIPNKTRNTSGILLNISKDRRMVLDCGEGTYGQLVRLYGEEGVQQVLASLHAVFVSHLHADHHIGLIGLVKARKRATAGANASSANGHCPLYLVAPKQIMTWLNYYNDHFEQILQQVEVVPNSDLIYNNVTLSGGMQKRLLASLNMSSILTAPVQHCPNAFGIAVEHSSGWKITYSGDTMPCQSLVELGKNSSLLIHEATMEDELQKEARMKMHSTTSEAIEIGKQMNARFTLLTHFSQRYATLPRLNEAFTDGIGIAFDNMAVRLTDLPKLPLFYPALKLIFSDHMEDLEQKAYKREMKHLRETNKISTT